MRILLSVFILTYASAVFAQKCEVGGVYTVESAAYLDSRTYETVWLEKGTLIYLKSRTRIGEPLINVLEATNRCEVTSENNLIYRKCLLLPGDSTYRLMRSYSRMQECQI